MSADRSDRQSLGHVHAQKVDDRSKWAKTDRLYGLTPLDVARPCPEGDMIVLELRPPPDQNSPVEVMRVHGIVKTRVPQVQVLFHELPPREIGYATWSLRVRGNSVTFEQALAALQKLVGGGKKVTNICEVLVGEHKVEDVFYEGVEWSLDLSEGSVNES